MCVIPVIATLLVVMLLTSIIDALSHTKSQLIISLSLRGLAYSCYLLQLRVCLYGLSINLQSAKCGDYCKYKKPYKTIAQQSPFPPVLLILFRKQLLMIGLSYH